MWWYIIPGTIALLALGVIGYVVRRAFPRLVIIDVQTIAGERDAERKRQIVIERAERLRATFFLKVRSWLRPRLKLFGERFMVVYRRALELERRYRAMGARQAGSAGRDQAARDVIEQAVVLAKEGRPREAEQKFIEAISLSPKNVKAYEELGRLYVREKQWQEAGEAFGFILKKDPSDASAHANMGELKMAQGDVTGAIAYYEKAAALKPANPQLQALLLDAALAAGNKDLSVRVFAKLKELAPQFPKIADFEERIRTM